MGDYSIIIFRTLVSYLLIIIIFRLMGKREIGELSILDLVVFIMLGDIAVIAIEKFHNPFLHTITPMLILLILQVAFSFISLKSSKFRKILDGKPSIIMNNGKIVQSGTHDELINQNGLYRKLHKAAYNSKKINPLTLVSK